MILNEHFSKYDWSQTTIQEHQTCEGFFVCLFVCLFYFVFKPTAEVGFLANVTATSHIIDSKFKESEPAPAPAPHFMQLSTNVHAPWEAADDGLHTWGPVTHIEDWVKIPVFSHGLVQPQLLHLGSEQVY